MTIFWYGINDGVGWCVADKLRTGFGVDEYLVTLGIDKGIKLGILYRYLMFVMMVSLRILWQETKIVSMLAPVDMFLIGWEFFDVYADAITFGIDKEIELGFSDCSFESFNDGNLKGLVTGVQYGIYTGVSLCVVGG